MSFPRIEGYVVTEKLGSGSYSTVYKAYTKIGARSTVAVKCIDKSRIKHSGAAVDNLVTEIKLLKTLTHPHIVHMKEFTWDDRNIYIIMEYCCGGDLSRYIQKYGRVPEKQDHPLSNSCLQLCFSLKVYPAHIYRGEHLSPHGSKVSVTQLGKELILTINQDNIVLYFLQQLASALKFLREKGVVHMDLKPHNLLLHKGSDAKYMLKVADFGFAQHISEETMRSVRGSPLYMAPEMIAGKYDARVDLWSVGVIMYECLFGKAPYSSATFKELVDKIERQDPIRIPSNAAVSPACLDLLTRLLQHDPNKRISYEEFFSHEYLDLEHMPNKENYDKAVDLIKRAIELDSFGALPEAFEAYSASLRYLVPAVSAESDALRRSALTAKLTRYMERAEEIKAFLRGAPPGRGIQTIQATQEVRTPTPVPRRGGGCCVSGVDGNSYDFSEMRNRKCPCNCISKQSGSNEFCSAQCRQRASNGVELGSLTVNGEQNSESSAQSSKNATEPPAGAKPLGALARLLRRAPVPYLNSKDDMPDTSTPEKSQKSVEDNSSDMCRIT